MKFKDLFFAFNELSPATMIEIYINHERVLMKAGEAAYQYGNLSVVSFNSRTVYLKRRVYNDARPINFKIVLKIPHTKNQKTCTKYIAI